MSSDPEQPTSELEPWRSKKYAQLSDDELIELSLKKQGDRDRVFLLKEIDHRNLSQHVAEQRRSQTKKEMKSKAWWKYLPLLFALVFVLKRMFGSF